jgi:hypothetical protein
MATPDLSSFFALLQQLQQANGAIPQVPPPPGATQGEPPQQSPLAALAAKYGKPGGGFVSGAAQKPAPPVINEDPNYKPDKFDQGGRRWRWDPKSGNYKMVR